MLVILIRSDNTPDVAVTVPLRLRAAGPKPGRFDENFGPSVQQEVYILGCLPVLPDRVRNVGGNVLFLLAAKDIDNLAVWINNLLRRRLRTAVRGFPGIHAAAPAHLGRLLPCAIDGPKPIHE